MNDLFTHHCPVCTAELKPIYKDTFKLHEKLMTYNEKGEIVEATPKEWLCESCKTIWRIEVVGNIC